MYFSDLHLLKFIKIYLNEVGDGVGLPPTHRKLVKTLIV